MLAETTALSAGVVASHGGHEACVNSSRKITFLDCENSDDAPMIIDNNSKIRFILILIMISYLTDFSFKIGKINKMLQITLAPIR